MRLFWVLVLSATLFGASSLNAGSARAETTVGPDGTPQFDRIAETMGYTVAAPLELKTYLAIVLAAVDALPNNPNPSQVKQSPLRKRLLDLRLILDLNAFAYRPLDYDKYRDWIDEAYEKIGSYKDLFDQQDLTGQAIDRGRQSKRLKDMNDALAPFRDPNARRELQQFIAAPAGQLYSLSDTDQPRIWRLSGTVPNAQLSSVANAARLSSVGLGNLVRDGLLVNNILNPDEEAHFHDVRKAMRSTLVLGDMFPSLAEAIGDLRQPLAALVDAYGEVNDRSIAYHDAQDNGGKVSTRASELQASFAAAQGLVKQYVDSGQLDAYVSRVDIFLLVYGG